MAGALEVFRCAAVELLGGYEGRDEGLLVVWTGTVPGEVASSAARLGFVTRQGSWSFG